MMDQLETSTKVTIAAHRGYSSKYPENTLLAFQKALDIHIDMIELDLRLSKDGEVMIIHDATVDRTTNGSGKVSDYSLDELKKLDAGLGEQIPTLEEFCQLIAPYPHLLCNIEIKPQDRGIEAADKAVDILQQYNFMDRCVFTSFDANIIHHLYDTYHVKTQGFASEKMRNYIHGEDGTFSKLWAIAIPMKDLEKETVQIYQQQGKQVWCYCPDTKEEVEYALYCGISLMTCNDPLPALELLR